MKPPPWKSPCYPLAKRLRIHDIFVLKKTGNVTLMRFLELS